MAELTDRQKHENRFAKRMGELSARHRRKLQRLMGYPPDPAKVPDSFWAEVEREEREEMLNLLLLIFLASATQHGLDEGRALSLAQAFASRRADVVASQRVAESKQMFDSAAREWRDVLDEFVRSGGRVNPDGTATRTVTDPATGRTTTKPVRKPLTKRSVFGRTNQIFGLRRNLRLVITETTDAATTAAEKAVDTQDLKSPNDRWLTESDARVCPICSPLHLKPRRVWEPKFPLGPPAHPSCRCTIVYINQRRLGKVTPTEGAGVVS